MTVAEAVYNDVILMSEIIADAVIKKMSPIDDEISTREAYRRYGTAWVKDMVRKGKIHSYRKGNKVQFSRHELDTLNAVEKKYAEIVTNI